MRTRSKTLSNLLAVLLDLVPFVDPPGYGRRLAKVQEAI